MFARGAIGDRGGLNFFLDSGPVSLHPSEGGGIRQAAAMADPRSWVRLGIDAAEVQKEAFELGRPIRLGPLERTGHLAVSKDASSWRSFGGLRIDAIVSHAFLCRYSWTIDFASRRFIFGR